MLFIKEVVQGDNDIMTFISEAVFGGVVSKVLSDITDVSKDKIREATKKKNNKHQSLESQIYNIVVDVLNKITYDEYGDNQDKIYDVAEKILKGFKSNENDNKGYIKIGLSDICEKVDENKCIDFMRLIYQELSKENYSELYREIRLLQQEKEGNKTSMIEWKVDETRYGVRELKEKLNEIINNKCNSVIDQSQIVKKKSRTQEYANKWNSNMFLNDFDKRDENAGVNIKLKDVYIDKHMPHYIWGNSERTNDDLKDLLRENIYENNENNMLLILGQPGIGKSTLITWIAANFNEKIDDILVYQFALDLKNIEWKSENIAERILKELGLSNEELKGKILVLDGYDEIRVKDDRKEILDQLYWDLVKNNVIKSFSLIVTCRVNYIKAVERVQCKYITLKPWNEGQIKSFCKIFCEITNISLNDEAVENIIKNKEILGVPLILYMVLALNISIEKEGSIVDVYDKIFSLEGGIYDRCIDNKSFADRHRVGKMKKQIHQISREIAIWIFENRPDEAYIPEEEYKKIFVNVLQENEGQENDIEQDHIIGIFFELRHCEGGKGEKLYFAHRSIYEYFVAESIFSSIENFIRDLSVENQKEFMYNISFYLKQGKITYTIGEYLKCKFIKVYESLSEEKKKYFYEWWETVVSKMVENGMFYFDNAKRKYKNIICKEITCFINLLELLRLVLVICKEKYLMKNVDREILEKYIKYAMIEYKITQKKKNSFDIFDLSNMCLKGIDLSGIDWIGVNFSEADLGEADLSGLNLSDANLRGANLELANLEGTDFSKADLGRANLRGAYLFCANLEEAFLMDAIIDNATFCRTEIEGSTWHKEDLEKIRSNLCGMDFTYVIQKDGDKRIKIYRKDICNIK